jgi:hypothetical protein
MTWVLVAQIDERNTQETVEMHTATATAAAATATGTVCSAVGWGRREGCLPDDGSNCRLSACPSSAVVITDPHALDRCHCHWQQPWTFFIYEVSTKRGRAPVRHTQCSMLTPTLCQRRLMQCCVHTLFLAIAVDWDINPEARVHASATSLRPSPKLHAAEVGSVCR